MDANQLRHDIKEFLLEQNVNLEFDLISTKLLCLIAAIYDYSFSDDMINETGEYLPNGETIKFYTKVEK